MLPMNEPSEIKVGVRVFCPYPRNLRALDPRLDIGTVVEMGTVSPEIVWVEKNGPSGTFKTPIAIDKLEAIG